MQQCILSFFTMHIHLSLSLSLLFTYSEGSPLIHVNFYNTPVLWQGFLLKSNVLTIVGSLIGFSGRGPSEFGAVNSFNTSGKGEEEVSVQNRFPLESVCLKYEYGDLCLLEW